MSFDGDDFVIMMAGLGVYYYLDMLPGYPFFFVGWFIGRNISEWINKCKAKK